jgi:hypothetical protein
LSHHKYLALASLLFTMSVAAPGSQGAATDPRPVPAGIGSPADNLSPVVLQGDLADALFPAVLPDAPSAVQQNTANQQPQTEPNPQQGPISSQEQLKIQERQRVLGVMAAFNTTTNHDALPLTPSQKFQLFFKSQTDPWPFALAAVLAGINQANDSFPEYGQGVEGYAKRYGAAYTDAFIGNLFGNAILTSWWHEDPRYFQKGTGSTTSRVLWAATSTVWCRRDNGTWGPNYANLAGNMVGAAIANVYYPESERTWGDTITRGLTVSAEGIIGSEVIEFWPDMLRRYRRKKAEKLARQNPPASQTAPSASSDPKP